MKAAQKAAFNAEDDQAVVVGSKMVGGIAQVRMEEQRSFINLQLQITKKKKTTLSQSAVIMKKIETCSEEAYELSFTHFFQIAHY